MTTYKTVSSYNLLIYNAQTFELIQEVVNFNEFTWTRHVWEMCEFSFYVHRNDIALEAASRDRLIVFTRNGQREFVGLIKTLSYDQSTQMWSIGGFCGKWFLKSRQVIPPLQTPQSSIQSWDSGTPTAGTFTIRIPKYEGSSETTASIAYDADIATIQAAVDLILEGDETITVGGTAPTSGGPVTFAFGGSYAERKIDLLEIRANSAFDGGIAVSETQAGIPPRAQYDTQTAVAAETAMRYYVENHLGASAVSDGAGSRDLNDYLDGIDFQFAQETDSERGPTITYNARYQNLLTEVLTDIGSASSLYFTVIVDMESSTSHGYRFTVYGETDATIDQSDNPQIVFGTEFGNASETTYDIDYTAEITTVFVLGPEKLGYRSPCVHDIDDEVGHDHDPSVFRVESVLDGRDTETESEHEVLAYNHIHRSVSERLTTTPLDLPLDSGYRSEWDIGYKVTVSIPRIGVTQNTVITGVSGSYDAQNGEQIRVTFGDQPRSLEDILSENFTQFNRANYNA